MRLFGSIFSPSALPAAKGSGGASHRQMRVNWRYGAAAIQLLCAPLCVSMGWLADDLEGGQLVVDYLPASSFVPFFRPARSGRSDATNGKTTTGGQEAQRDITRITERHGAVIIFLEMMILGGCRQMSCSHSNSMNGTSWLFID